MTVFKIAETSFQIYCGWVCGPISPFNLESLLRSVHNVAVPQHVLPLYLFCSPTYPTKHVYKNIFDTKNVVI